MRNTADVTSGKPFDVLLQPISGESAINSLVAFYDIHGGKRQVLFFYFVPDTTRDYTFVTSNSCYWAIATGFLRCFTSYPILRTQQQH
jgi:hypothetical protein